MGADINYSKNFRRRDCENYCPIGQTSRRAAGLREIIGKKSLRSSEIKSARGYNARVYSCDQMAWLVLSPTQARNGNEKCSDFAYFLREGV